MAIKNSVTVEFTAGFSIAADNVIVSAIHFPQPQPQYDEEGAYTGIIRKITYDLFPYVSEADITTEGKTFVGGEMVLIPSGWEKVMDDAEYAALLADGSLAEVWLKDYIQSLIGGTSTVIDPYPAV
jgi:hypothetical protein